MIDIDNLDDLDAVLAQMIQQARQEKPFTPAEEITVRAIVALSTAGAALMTDASHADSRDTARLSTRAAAQLADARHLMSTMIYERRRPAPDETVGCMDCGGGTQVVHHRADDQSCRLVRLPEL